MNYQDIQVDFDYKIEHILDITFTCGYGNHPVAHLKGIVDEKERKRFLQKINSDTSFTIRNTSGRILFTGYVSEVRFELEGGLYYLYLTALGATAKLDVLKRSRTFFKKRITYQEIVDTVLSSYPGAALLSHVDFSKKTDFPIIQYQETDWEFLTRVASLFGAVLRSFENFDSPRIEAGYEKMSVETNLQVSVVETGRDVLTCEKDFYGRSEVFSVIDSGTDKIKSGAIETPDVLDYTWKAFTLEEYYPVGTMLRINGQELAVSYVEGYLDNGDMRYDYIVRLPESVKTNYHDNDKLPGASLAGTVKKRKGNTISIALDIDKDDGIDSEREDYFFTYAIESKDFYCMPVEGAKVHLYFPTGKEWEAIAVHSLRNTSEGAQRGDKTANPSDRSLSNDTGSAIHLTPDAITMSPDDGRAVNMKLGKDGNVEISGNDLWIIGENITIGKGEDGGADASKVTISAGDTLFLSRMTGDETGMVPVEDHFIATKGVTQLYATSHILHDTRGPALPITPTYDDSALIEQETQQAADNNRQVADVLIERNREARSKFGRGLLMAALGTALIVCTGGAAAVAVGAALCVFAAADMSEATQSHELAMSGDWSTPAENILKEFIPEPAYSLIENGLIIAGSIIFAGPALAGKMAAGATINTGVELAFDLVPDGKLDKSPMDYLNSFSTNLMVSALTGPIARMDGCSSQWATFGKQYASGFASSTMAGIAHGDLSLRGLGENFIREGLSAGIGTRVGYTTNGKNKWLVAGADTLSDTVIDSGMQLWDITMGRQDSFDWKRCAQTAVSSGINNFIMACDPINCARGNLLIFKADLVFRGLYGEEKWFRRYDSVLDYDGAFGKGWLHTFESFVFAEETADGWQITAMLPDTHKENFLYRDGEWSPQKEGAPYHLEIKPEGGFVLEERVEGSYTAYHYDKKGRLTALQGHQGCAPTCIFYVESEENAPAFTRSRIDHVEYPGGQRLDFTYKDRLVTSVTDHAGRKITYHYQNGRLMSVKYPTGGCQEYAYDKEGHIAQLKGEDGREFMRNEYDRTGRVTAQHYPDGTECRITYDDRERKTTFRYSDTGREEINYYNPKHEVIRREFGDGIQELMEYDLYGNRISHTDRNGSTTSYVYGKNGLLLEKHSPEGLVTCYAYDEAGRLTEESDNTGAQKKLVYDQAGRLIQESVLTDNNRYSTTTYTRDGYGRMLTMTDALGNTTKYAYEENIDQPTQVDTPEGYMYRYSYDRAGRRTKITTDHGTKELCYSETGAVSMETDALGNSTRYFYDSAGNMLKSIRPNQYDEQGDNGAGTYYEYDYLDRPVLIKYPDGSRKKTVRDMDGNVLCENPFPVLMEDVENIVDSYSYDRRQYLVKEQAPDGGVTYYERDRNGNLLKAIRPEEYAQRGRNGAGIRYTYDKENRLTAIHDEEGRTFRRLVYDKKGRLTESVEGEARSGTRYVYDAAGRPVQKWVPVRTEPDAGDREPAVLCNVTLYEYDPAGNRILERRSPDEVREGSMPVHFLDIRMSYDRQNRLVQVEDSLGAAASYTYDCLNNRLTEKYRVNETAYRLICYKYDAAGRLTDRMESVDPEDVGQEAGSYCKKAFLHTRYEYDKNGNMIRLQLPNGGEVTRDYDIMDRIVRESIKDEKSGTDTSVTFTYDAAGRPTARMTQDGEVHRYSYDNCGRLISETDEEGAVTRYFHNKNGELIKAVSADNYDSTIDDGEGYTFAYDAFGRLIEVRDAYGHLCESNVYDAAGRIKSRHDAAGALSFHEYDIGGRQTAVYTGEGEKPLQTYTYDSLGSITGVTDGEQNHTEFELDAWGRITGITNTDGSRESYTYDHAGNITSTTDGRGGVIRYDYNSMLKPGKVTDQAGNADTFTYDGEGNPAGQTDRNGKTIRREYGSFGLLLSEQGEDGTFNRRKYDRQGRLTENASNHISYRYDYTRTGRPKTRYINGKAALRYTYTKAGRTASITDICGKTTEYGYDLNGRLASVSEKGKVLAAYTYDAAGRVKNITFANGMQTLYAYDRERNLASVETKNADGSILLSYSYQYDRNGNRTGKKDLKNGNSTTYLYDTMQRLSEATYPETGKETYHYDEAGNRIQKQTIQTLPLTSMTFRAA